MTDIGLVLHKLQRLRDQIALVRARRPASPDALQNDLVLRDALALALLIAAQECVDVAYHIAADEGWGVPDSHAAAFDLLAERGVLHRKIADELTGIARLRNRIAHGYASVDHSRIWHELPSGIDALEAFVRTIAAWLPAIPPG